MSQPTIKEIRNQVRNVTRELLPSLLETEALTAIYTRLNKDLSQHIELIKQDIQKTLNLMDERSRDVQAYALRQLNTMSNSKADEPIVMDALTGATNE
jgi:predicted component of type VI protein secretion system